MTHIDSDPVPHGADPPPGKPEPSLREEISELKKAFADFTEHQRPEADRIRQELAAAIQERDAHQAELNRLRRGNAIGEWAGKTGFADAEYLDFLLAKHQIDPADAARTGEFLAAYRNGHPRAFQVPLAPGGGSRPGSGVSAGGNSAGNVELLLENAPELF